ncbi:hypothetical protein QYE76_038998 [Lolium multiflorum]|uniref:Uncharacterized protein n=1 Tax=Lolium multiflorum TaxID=4521 RepID=A0AAD8WRT0_LOLMU|nr:hypothetical protein QYE76_038998 [Lolium multiflorum]
MEENTLLEHAYEEKRPNPLDPSGLRNKSRLSRAVDTFYVVKDDVPSNAPSSQGKSIAIDILQLGCSCGCSVAKSGAAGRASSCSARMLSTSSGSGRLAGKVAIITGAASGIGKATAVEFVKNGAKVVIADIQDDLGHAVVAELGGSDTALYARCDVTNEAQVAAAVDLALARHGRLDVMFNNAGIIGTTYAGGPIESMDLADFDRVMAVNLRGVAAGIKHAARAMVPHNHGCILCTASTAGMLGGAAPTHTASPRQPSSAWCGQLQWSWRRAASG